MDWQDTRTMTADEFRRALARLGLTYADADRYLGRYERTARRYGHGTTRVPTADVLLLSALIALKIKPKVPR